MSNTPIESQAAWTGVVMYADPKSTRPHRDASPAISMCVLRGLVREARAAGVKWLDVDEIEDAIDRYVEVSRS